MDVKTVVEYDLELRVRGKTEKGNCCLKKRLRNKSHIVDVFIPTENVGVNEQTKISNICQVQLERKSDNGKNPFVLSITFEGSKKVNCISNYLHSQMALKTYIEILFM